MRNSTHRLRSVSPCRTSPSGSGSLPPADVVRRACELQCRKACAATVASTRGASPGRSAPSRSWSASRTPNGRCSSRATSNQAHGPASMSRPSCAHPPARARSSARKRRTKTNAEAQGASTRHAQASKSKAEASRRNSPQQTSRTASRLGSLSSKGLAYGAESSATPRKARQRCLAASSTRPSSPPASLCKSSRALLAQASLSSRSRGTCPSASSGTSSCTANASSNCTGCSTPSAEVRVSQAASLWTRACGSPSVPVCESARAE
mmetsp:Transcript_102592/g.319706  ORF Transcript_102592/g.319706 Transcript_102592/m.319706 type:complete len:265 (+) Transcript_102592:356-1150(+)